MLREEIHIYVTLRLIARAFRGARFKWGQKEVRPEVTIAAAPVAQAQAVLDQRNTPAARAERETLVTTEERVEAVVLQVQMEREAPVEPHHPVMTGVAAGVATVAARQEPLRVGRMAAMAATTLAVAAAAQAAMWTTPKSASLVPMVAVAAALAMGVVEVTAAPASNGRPTALAVAAAAAITMTVPMTLIQETAGSTAVVAVGHLPTARAAQAPKESS